MARFAVSVLDGSEMVLTSAEFNTQKAARDFIEWRIEELLDDGAAYVIIPDKNVRTETRYRAAGIADCVFVLTDWRYALVKEAA